MRKSISTEIVIFFLVGIAGALISRLTLITFVGGYIILTLTSYFLIRKLKEHTIKEYIEAVENAKRK